MCINEKSRAGKKESTKSGDSCFFSQHSPPRPHICESVFLELTIFGLLSPSLPLIFWGQGFGYGFLACKGSLKKNIESLTTVKPPLGGGRKCCEKNRVLTFCGLCFFPELEKWGLCFFHNLSTPMSGTLFFSRAENFRTPVSVTCSCMLEPGFWIWLPGM